ncbi:MAG: hypothetical protein ACEQSR_12725 [Candidatus Methylacidiphilales bacterium]
MKVILNVSILLIIACLLHSCSPKLNQNLSRSAIINVNIVPVFKNQIEVSNHFFIGLVVKLNNGKIKRKFFEVDDAVNSETNDGLEEQKSYWNNFNITTYNCIFNNGKISINRKSKNIPDFVAIKISLKNGITSDSFGIQIPKINAVKIEYKTNTTLSPSFLVPFNLVAYFNNDKKITINNNNSCDGFAGNYKVKIQNNYINYPYLYQIPTETDFKTSFTVVCSHNLDTSLHDSINIPLKYDGHYRFSYKGVNGQNGSSGSDAYRSLRNGNGENGQRGQQGQNGGTGPKVHIILKSFLVDSTLYIKAITHSNEVINTCIINPKLGKLTVLNTGGSGGFGGEGGGGANGEDQTDKTSAGIGGSGGEGGDGGEGGKGGSFKVYADSAASFYFDRIELVNNGGYGGQGGRGGKNGATGNEKSSGAGSYLLQSILRSIITGRGPTGMSGYNGEKGEDPIFEIISKKAIEQMEQRVRKR